MLIWENIKLALSGILGNKMRSVLTMLGIIIGIGSVIAIMTVSTSLTSSISSTFAGLGANNVTVGVKKQSEQQETRSNGMRFGFSNRQVSMDEDDLISDEMIDEIKQNFGNQITSVSLSKSVGSGTVSSAGNSASISVTGINNNYYDANDVELITGRYLTAEDVDGEKAVIMVSDLFIDTVFGEGTEYSSVLGKKILVEINNIYYPFYIVGVYNYEEDSESFSSDSDDEVETDAYIPITTGKEKLHSSSGYRQFTIVTSETVTDVSTVADLI